MKLILPLIMLFILDSNVQVLSQNEQDTNFVNVFSGDRNVLIKQAHERTRIRLIEKKEKDSIMQIRNSYNATFQYKYFTVNKLKGLIREGVTIDTLLPPIYSSISKISEYKELYKIVSNGEGIALYNAEKQDFVIPFSMHQMYCIDSEIDKNEPLIIVEKLGQAQSYIYDHNGIALFPTGFKEIVIKDDYFICRNNRENRLFDRATKSMRQVVYQNLFLDDNTNFLVAKYKDHFGVISSNGDFVINPVYDSIKLIPTIKKAGLWQILNSDSLILLSLHDSIPKLFYLDQGEIMGIYDRFHVIQVNGKYGLLNSDLNWCFPLIYDDIRFYQDNGKFDKGILFSVKQEKDVKILNTDGIEQNTFKNISSVTKFNEIRLLKVEKSGKYAIFHETDGYFTKFNYDDIYFSLQDTQFLVRSGNKIGKLNIHGKITESLHNVKTKGFTNLEDVGKSLVLALQSENPEDLRKFAELMTPDSLTIMKLVSSGLVDESFSSYGMSIFSLNNHYFEKLIDFKKTLSKQKLLTTLEFKNIKVSSITNALEFKEGVDEHEQPIIISLYSNGREIQYSLGNISLIDKKLKALSICYLYHL